MKQQKNRKKTALLLAVVFLFLLAAPVMAGAVEHSTPKQEVVYVNLAADGSVADIYVVNIFDLDKTGQIIDYGDYTALRNMTTDDEILFEDETVRIQTEARKLYYEGHLRSDVIPWIFAIHYALDGAACSAEELAGKSGHLEITMDIGQNKECRSTFFEHYSLQTSITLDTGLCKNIAAEGATVANVGGDKQLTYTILPGKEKSFTVTADVTDFTMDSIAINGLPLALDVEMGAEQDAALRSEVDLLEDAVADLNHGANEVKDGAADVRDGAAEVTDGAAELKDGTVDLQDGTTELQDGVNDLHDGAVDLRDGAADLQDGAADLQSGAADLQTGAADLHTGVQDAVKGADKLYTGIVDLQDGVMDLHNGATDLREGLSALQEKNPLLLGGAQQIFDGLLRQVEGQINAGIAAQGLPIQIELKQEDYNKTIDFIMAYGRLENTTTGQSLRFAQKQLNEVETFQAGLKDYTDGVTKAANGAAELTDGTTDLRDGVDELHTGAGELYDGLRKLQDGSAELLNGTITLHDGTITLSDSIITLQDGTVSLLNGVVDLQDGVIELCNGAVTLKDGAVELLDGAIALQDGTVKLYDGTVELTDGTVEFRDKTSHLDKDLRDKINEAIADMLGGDFNVVSFVSAKNTQVEAVQFVIKTPAIGGEDTALAEPIVEEKLTFWQKLLRLFGLY